MQLAFDPAANAAYLSFRPIPRGAAVRQLELEPGVIADFTAEGRLLGLEFLDPQRYFSDAELSAATA